MLSPRFADTISTPGRYLDENKLFLVVGDKGSKRWMLRYWLNGRRRDMGLGSFSDVGLGQARRAAAAVRGMIADGIDPIDERRARKSVQTFGDFAEAHIKVQEKGWKGDKTAAGWRNTIFQHAKALVPLRLSDIKTNHVLGVLRPIWHAKPETAQKLQNRLERLFDAAAAAGLTSGQNPARWRGHLQHLLPPRVRLSRGNHPAAPYELIPEIMHLLAAKPSMGALALRFLILTAMRESAILNATWDQIDLSQKIWTIPGKHMKGRKSEMREVFIVPLSQAAIDVLATASTRAGSTSFPATGLIFPGNKPGRPMSNATLDKAFKTLGDKYVTAEGQHYTPHGCRSTFRDWAGDKTDFADSVAEMALAHKVGSSMVRAYRRLNAFEKRAELMEAWGTFATSHQAATGQS